MPLFQPSNITPSSFAGVGGGTVAVADNVKITWQVNGNVAMTAYKIDIFDTDNNNVYSSGILTNIPFYPTDRKGNPQYFSYIPNVSWGSLGLTDGNDYTLQITQYWGNFTDSDHSVTQFSQSAFITRTTPTLSISTASANSVFEDFTATYTQAQGDSIDWVRWKFYQDNTLIDDTGSINTQVLSYRADNMQSGNTYKIVCTIQTENGIQVETEQSFTVSYELQEIVADFKFDCFDKASNLLSWTDIGESVGADIQGVSNDNNYSFDDGSLVLPKDSTVTWGTKNNSQLIIPADWTMEWRGLAKANYSLVKTLYQSPVTSIATSGNIVVISTPGGTRTYLIEGDELVSTNGISGASLYLKFSPNGEHLVSYNNANLVIYSVDTNSSGGVMFTEIGTINEAPVNAFDFISNSRLMVGFQNKTETGYIRFYDLLSNRISPSTTNYFPDFDTAVVDIKARKDGEYVIISNAYHYVELYELNGYSPKFKSTISYNGIGAVEFLNNIDAFYVSVGGGNIYLYNINDTTTPIQTISADISVTSLYCDRQDLALFVGGGTGRTAYIQTYSLDRNGVAEYIREETLDSAIGNKVSYIGISDDDKFMIIGTGANTHLWETIAPEETTILKANNLVCKIDKGFSITYNSTNLISVTHSEKICDYLIGGATIEISAISINKNSVTVIYNGQAKQNNVTFTQDAITEVSVLGEQTCKYLYIESGTSVFPETFVPIWNANTQFLTHFDINSLQAGQLDVSESVMDIFRENITTGEFVKLYSCRRDTKQIRDFSWITGNRYNYYGYARLDNAYTSANLANKSVVCRNQPYYLLLEAYQDEEQPNAYHVVRYWRFGNNIEAGSIGNNNTPNFLNNFTGYRLKQPTARKSKSGTLTALLSNAYNGEYQDTVKQMEELYALSESKNALFLKDMKGNLYMVTVSSPITQTINTKSVVQEVKVSIPWEEIGSCEGISIIQIPTDEGWIDDGE